MEDFFNFEKYACILKIFHCFLYLNRSTINEIEFCNIYGKTLFSKKNIFVGAGQCKRTTSPKTLADTITAAARTCVCASRRASRASARRASKWDRTELRAVVVPRSTCSLPLGQLWPECPSIRLNCGMSPCRSLGCTRPSLLTSTGNSKSSFTLISISMSSGNLILSIHSSKSFCF